MLMFTQKKGCWNSRAKLYYPDNTSTTYKYMIEEGSWTFHKYFNKLDGGYLQTRNIQN